MSAAEVILVFESESSRREFVDRWLIRTSRPAVDHTGEPISSGALFVGDAAERALDLANEVLGVFVEQF